MNTAIRMANAKSLVVFKESDHRGRQRFIVRKVQGDRVFECRKFKQLVTFLKGQEAPVKVFDELPESAQKIIRSNCVVGAGVARMGEPERPSTMADALLKAYMS